MWRRCPLCRTLLHVGREMPVTVTLKAVLQHSFPQEYKQRHEEECQHISPGGQPDAQAPVPLFVMSCLLPGEPSSAAAEGHEQARGVAPICAILLSGPLQHQECSDHRMSLGLLSWAQGKKPYAAPGHAGAELPGPDHSDQQGCATGERMALNIFEPRYRLMVRRCMEGNRCFGMASVSQGHALSEVACLAEIMTCQPLPDGCVRVLSA